MNFENTFSVPMNFSVYGPQGQENLQTKEVLAPGSGPLSKVALWGPCNLLTEIHEDPRNFSLGFNLWTSFWAT